MQRLVVSSTRAIRPTLERRLAVLQSDEDTVSRRIDDVTIKETVDIYDMDGEELLGEILQTRVRALRNEARQARILLSTDAGGEGLNLQFCHVVINYDMPWNPMRIEQRIGRVDRIGQPKTVRALNFVFEDSVEFRVREVLEQKLAVIFAEFGIDKTGDVLDSAQAGEIFEDLFMDVILDPESVEHAVDQTVSRIRCGIQDIRENSAIYDLSEDLDVHDAALLRDHPLPHWVEKMTTAFLNSHGGQAIRKKQWWDLRWPDGDIFKKQVFLTRDAEKYSGTTLLNLEKEEKEWRQAIETARQIIPEIRPLLLLGISGEGSS